MPGSRFATPKDDMDRLDLEMMLSCLDPRSTTTSRRGGFAATSSKAARVGGGGLSLLAGKPAPIPPPLTEPEQAGLRAVTVANMTLFLDATCVVMIGVLGLMLFVWAVSRCCWHLTCQGKHWFLFVSRNTILNEDYWTRDNVSVTTSW